MVAQRQVSFNHIHTSALLAGRKTNLCIESGRCMHRSIWRAAAALSSEPCCITNLHGCFSCSTATSSATDRQLWARPSPASAYMKQWLQHCCLAPLFAVSNPNPTCRHKLHSVEHQYNIRMLHRYSPGSTCTPNKNTAKLQQQEIDRTAPGAPQVGQRKLPRKDLQFRSSFFEETLLQ